MNKRLTMMLCACVLGGMTSAYGANPFSDVDLNSWAYAAVSELHDAGIINGYPDGTFKGNKELTRFEMAQMVAKALANQDKANAEQQALINRLVDEFTAELQTLGVRIAKLENNVDNVKMTGNFRLRYRGSEFKNGMYAYGKHSSFDYRARIIMRAKVNENTDAVVRLQGFSNIGEGKRSFEGKVNWIFVDHHLDKDTTLRVGRQLYTPGQGLMYDDLMDGVRLMHKRGRWDTSLSYGYWWGGAGALSDRKDTITALFGEVKGKVNDHITLGAMYGKFQKGNLFQGFDSDGSGGSQKSFIPSVYKHIWGINGEFKYGRWSGFGEWLTAPGVKDSQGWMASVGYGTYNIKQPHTYSIRAQYFYEEPNSPIFSSAHAPAYGFYNSHYVDGNGVAHVRRGYKGFVGNINYVPAKNVSIGAYYGFYNKDFDGGRLGDYWRTDVNFNF